MENHNDESINFGRSLIVPSVQELAKKSITKIPPRYVRQDHNQKPLITSSDDTSNLSVPVIDLHTLFATDSGSSPYSSELSKLHTAAKQWGFFQVSVLKVYLTRFNPCKLEIVYVVGLQIMMKSKSSTNIC